MTELPNFIDVYTYAPDPDYEDGTPTNYYAEFINGELVRTNHINNPSFDHLPGYWTPPAYSHISEDWSVTGNTSLYVEPSEGFGGYSALSTVWYTDHLQVEGRYTGQKLYIDGKVIAETTNGNLLLKVSIQDHVAEPSDVTVYASDGYWDNLMVTKEYEQLGDFFYSGTPSKVVVRHWEPQTKWQQDRVAEYGIDRGILYLSNDVVVPWNGLVRVSENIDGVDIQPYYVDGVKRLDVPSTFEIEGEIEAYSAPKQFAAYVGEAEIAPGFYGSNQMPRPFSLSYRTRVNTDDDKQHYKIHILYNVLAQPGDREYNTMGEDTDPTVFTWEFKTTPQAVGGIRSSLFTIDSREINPVALAIIESRLYGYDQDEPDILTPDEITAVIADHPL